MMFHCERQSGLVVATFQNRNKATCGKFSGDLYENFGESGKVFIGQCEIA